MVHMLNTTHLYIDYSMLYNYNREPEPFSIHIDVFKIKDYSYYRNSQIAKGTKILYYTKSGNKDLISSRTIFCTDLFSMLFLLI